MNDNMKKPTIIILDVEGKVFTIKNFTQSTKIKFPIELVPLKEYEELKNSGIKLMNIDKKRINENNNMIKAMSIQILEYQTMFKSLTTKIEKMRVLGYGCGSSKHLISKDDVLKAIKENSNER